MAHSPLRPHLHPEELARRQRWVAVGVTILTILLVVTWFLTLPGRISQASGEATGWKSFFGDVPKTSFIDADALINNPARQEQEAQMMQAVNDLNAPVPTPTPEVITTTTTPPVATTTPISVPNKNKK